MRRPAQCTDKHRTPIAISSPPPPLARPAISSWAFPIAAATVTAFQKRRREKIFAHRTHLVAPVCGSLYYSGTAGRRRRGGSRLFSLSRRRRRDVAGVRSERSIAAVRAPAVCEWVRIRRVHAPIPGGKRWKCIWRAEGGVHNEEWMGNRQKAGLFEVREWEKVALRAIGQFWITKKRGDYKCKSAHKLFLSAIHTF